MTDPTREVSRATRLDNLPPPPADLIPTEEPYVKEPLFSKKVMAAWALVALAVWFAFTFIAPEVIQAIKAEIIESARPPATPTPVPEPPEPPAPVEPVSPAGPVAPAPRRYLKVVTFGGTGGFLARETSVFSRAGRKMSYDEPGCHRTQLSYPES